MNGPCPDCGRTLHVANDGVLECIRCDYRADYSPDDPEPPTPRAEQERRSRPYIDQAKAIAKTARERGHPDPDPTPKRGVST